MRVAFTAKNLCFFGVLFFLIFFFAPKSAIEMSTLLANDDSINAPYFSTSLLQSQYLSMVPIRICNFSSVPYDEDQQREIYDRILSLDIVKRYPPSKTFQQSFIKKLIENIEISGHEVLEGIYSMYVSLISPPMPDDNWSPRDNEGGIVDDGCWWDDNNDSTSTAPEGNIIINGINNNRTNGATVQSTQDAGKQLNNNDNNNECYKTYCITSDPNTWITLRETETYISAGTTGLVFNLNE